MGEKRKEGASPEEDQGLKELQAAFASVKKYAPTQSANIAGLEKQVQEKRAQFTEDPIIED